METPLTVGSLFAGIGGLDLGLERAGMKCVWQVEIDSYARRILEKHWPDVRRWDDVRTFPPEPVDEWRCDLIAGGDPCQANSIASGSAGSRKQSLGGEFLRVVAAIRPRLVLRENPTARQDAPWPWWAFRAGLESLGYAVVPFRLRACCVGGDHERERVFLFAELVHTNGDRLERRDGQTAKGRWEPEYISPPVETFDWPPIPGPSGYGSRDGIPGGVDRIEAIGNAVVPQVAEWIGRRIVESIQ